MTLHLASMDLTSLLFRLSHSRRPCYTYLPLFSCRKSSLRPSIATLHSQSSQATFQLSHSGTAASRSKRSFLYSESTKKLKYSYNNLASKILLFDFLAFDAIVNISFFSKFFFVCPDVAVINHTECTRKFEASIIKRNWVNRMHAWMRSRSRGRGLGRPLD